MKKIVAILLIALLPVIFGCAGFGKFSPTGAQVANTAVTKAMQLLGIVQTVIMPLQTFMGIPSFAEEVLPYLTIAQSLEQTLHDFINNHTNQEVTADQEAQVAQIDKQVVEVQQAVNMMTVKLARMTKALQAENSKLKAAK